MSDDFLSFAMLSDPGQVRRRNEDACAADLDHGVFVVCDGVGGAAGGEVASQLAAETFIAQMTGSRELSAGPKSGIFKGIDDANHAVHSQSLQRTELYGMATTMVALVFDPVCDPIAGADAVARDGETGGAGTIWLANVGDSRCYRLRQGEFEQLTHDHSLVEEQVRSGIITREQAENSPIRNVITRAVGSEAGVRADVQSLAACHGDLYLLASDGLTRELAVDDVAKLLRSTPDLSEPANGRVDQGTLAATCAELVRNANMLGGGDNITCLLVHVR